MWQGKLWGFFVTARSEWRVPWGLGQGELGLYVTEGHAWGKLGDLGQEEVWGTSMCGTGISALWVVKVRPSLITMP